MKHLHRLGLLIYISALLLPALPAAAINVQTQNRAALQVSPAINELSVERGEPTQTIIQVTNLTDKSLIVNTLAEKLELAAGTQTTHEELFNASSWISIANPQFAIQPGEQRSVTVTVHPPANADPGSHYATIFFESLLPRESLAPNTALETARVGSLLFMNVRGQRVIGAALAVPLITSKFRQFGPVDFHFAIANAGNSHILPSGSIKITDWRGTQVAELNLPTGLVLPQTIRHYDMDWDKGLLFGRYTATLVVSYGAEQNPLQSSVTFWVAPVWLILSIIIFIAALIWLAVVTKGRWGRALRVFFSSHRH